jgi:hypothetical protein
MNMIKPPRISPEKKAMKVFDITFLLREQALDPVPDTLEDVALLPDVKCECHCSLTHCPL